MEAILAAIVLATVTTPAIAIVVIVLVTTNRNSNGGRILEIETILLISTVITRRSNSKNNGSLADSWPSVDCNIFQGKWGKWDNDD